MTTANCATIIVRRSDESFSNTSHRIESNKDFLHSACAFNPWQQNGAGAKN